VSTGPISIMPSPLGFTQWRRGTFWNEISCSENEMFLLEILWQKFHHVTLPPNTLKIFWKVFMYMQIDKVPWSSTCLEFDGEGSIFWYPSRIFSFCHSALMASGQAPQILERSKDRSFAYTYVIHNQVIWYLGLALRLTWRILWRYIARDSAFVGVYGSEPVTEVCSTFFGYLH
jgi:hypothetical protein